MRSAITANSGEPSRATRTPWSPCSSRARPPRASDTGRSVRETATDTSAKAASATPAPPIASQVALLPDFGDFIGGIGFDHQRAMQPPAPFHGDAGDAVARHGERGEPIGRAPRALRRRAGLPSTKTRTWRSAPRIGEQTREFRVGSAAPSTRVSALATKSRARRVAPSASARMRAPACKMRRPTPIASPPAPAPRRAAGRGAGAGRAFEAWRISL